jgi:hypothetical protein
MPDDAVMDAAADVDVSTPDTGEEAGGEESTPDTPVAEAEQPDQTDKITTPELKLIDGGKLSADAKKHLEELKTTNPPLAKALQRALYRGAEIDKALPGGIKELAALKQTVETLGGENGIKDIQAEVNGWHQFDEQYMAGDPKAIDFMTSEPEGREAFLKLIPSALAKYEELHPDGFSQYMAQVIGGTMGQHGIPLALERLSDFIGDNPKAIEQFNKLAGFVKFIGDLSTKQVQAPKFQQAAPDNERAQFEQERSQFEREKWRNETAAEQKQSFDSEWARLSAGRKLTDQQTAAIQELFGSRFDRAIAKHSETLDRYFGAKDKNGFLRYTSQLSKTEVPKALREAFETILPQKPGPRPGTAPAPAKNGTPAKGVAIAQGFTQIAQQPNYATDVALNNPFNSIDRFRSGMAILKDGRKVQWKKA